MKPSLTDLPNDMLFVIMKKLGKDSYGSYVRAKASCKLLRDIGEENGVLKHLSINHIPLFAEVNNEPVRRVTNVLLEAGNMSVVLRIGMVHLFCNGGDYKYGKKLIKRASRRGLVLLRLYVVS